MGEYQKGDLAYKLSDALEFKQKFLSLEKETKSLKEEIKQWGETSKQWDVQTLEIQKAFRHYRNEKEKEIAKMQADWQNDMNKSRLSIQKDIEKCGNVIDEKNNVKIKKLKECYDGEIQQMQERINNQKELIDQQTKVMTIQENDIKCKREALEYSINQLQIRSEAFGIDPQVGELANGDSASNSPQTNKY